MPPPEKIRSEAPGLSLQSLYLRCIASTKDFRCTPLCKPYKTKLKAENYSFTHCWCYQQQLNYINFNKKASQSLERLTALVIPIGFEPMTYCLEGSCSIQLSYGTKKICTELKSLTLSSR